MTLEKLLLLSFVVFSIGLFGVLARRHIVALLLSLELMFNAVNLANSIGLHDIEFLGFVRDKAKKKAFFKVD